MLVHLDQNNQKKTRAFQMKSDALYERFPNNEINDYWGIIIVSRRQKEENSISLCITSTLPFFSIEHNMACTTRK